MKLVLFAGSLRKDSLNKKLLNVIKHIVETKTDFTPVVIDIKSLNIPLYDGDIEAQGIPDGVTKLGEEISTAAGVIISSPEYNGSISSPLKNTIDWLSRLRPIPLEKKPVLLTGASPGSFGTIRAQAHAKPSLENLKAFVFHTPFMLPRADKVFSDDGDLDEESKKRLLSLIESYVPYVMAINSKL